MTWLQGLALLAMTALLVGLGFTCRQQTLATDMDAEILATNMHFYVSAVEKYAAEHQGQTGSVSQNQLNLPFGWKAAKPWENILTEDRIVVFGPPLEDADVLSKLNHYTGDFGIKKGGRLCKSEGTGECSLPASVPEGAIAFTTDRL